MSVIDPVVITEDAIPRLPRGVKLRHDKTRNTWVLLAPERVFMPDPIAVEILKRCTGEVTLSGMIEDLAQTYAAPREQIAKDVTSMLQDLADKGMVEV